MLLHLGVVVLVDDVDFIDGVVLDLVKMMCLLLFCFLSMLLLL